MLKDSAESSGQGDWHVNMTVPADLNGVAELVDPLVTLACLGYGAGRVEGKMTDVVQTCRDVGKSWTQIGEVLGMTKQSAWERFSGED